MATPAQTTANRTNSQASTGPRTETGKAASARNAIRHGLTGRTLIVRAGEREEFERFQKDFQAEIQPRGALQIEVYGQLLLAAWNLRRISRVESELITETGDDPLLAGSLDAQLRTLDRYRARNERAFKYALAEIARLQEETLFRHIRVPQQGRDLPRSASIARVRRAIAADQAHYGSAAQPATHPAAALLARLIPKPAAT
jgi:hypothetical protein